MKKIEFSIDIDAPKKKVWETMLNPDSYKEWVKVSWPGSYYEGKWAAGKNIRFLSSGGGGTMAKLSEHTPFESVKAEHVAVILSDGSEDRKSEVAKGWIGTKEAYSFSERNGVTTVKVEIETSPDWASMFKDGWPAALRSLKALCEN